MKFCQKCGTQLADDSLFCSNCGWASTVQTTQPQPIQPKPVQAQPVQPQPVQPQPVQPQPVQPQPEAMAHNIGTPVIGEQAEIGVNKKTNRKKLIGILIGAVATVAVTVLGIVFIPKLFVSVEDLCSAGRYQEAYEKADTEDEKFEILAENTVAVQSAVYADKLKDPSSFELRDAYYKDVVIGSSNVKQVVLYSSGTNSYGARVSSYSHFADFGTGSGWTYFGSYSDLTEEEYGTYDTADEREEIDNDNLAKSLIRGTIENGIKLSDDAVDRINGLFQADMLDDVRLIEE